MNLSQMLSMAGSILDYSPDVPSYRAELRRFINEAYRELFSNDLWTFAQREEHIEINPDVEVTAMSLVTSGSTVKLQDGGAGAPFASWMSGAIVEITAGTAPFSVLEGRELRSPQALKLKQDYTQVAV